jgi:hypothetical protein
MPRLFTQTIDLEAWMTAQQKREGPEFKGGSRKDRPEVPKPAKSKPEMSGRGEPGTMPENPANVDRVHEPAGIDAGTDRTKER